MKLQVYVKDGAAFSLSVGAGHQPLRWLALVAAQRGSLTSPRGRIRQREPSDAMGSKLIPARIDSVSTLELHDSPLRPSDKILDVFSDGDEVFVSLASATKTDCTGAPIDSDWAMRAYKHSDMSATHHRAVKSRVRAAAGAGGTASGTQALERRQAIIAEVEEMLGGASARSKREAQEKEAFEADFEALAIAKEMLGSGTRVEELAEVLSTHYAAIRDVFRYYSNVGGKGLTLTRPAGGVLPPAPALTKARSSAGARSDGGAGSGGAGTGTGTAPVESFTMSLNEWLSFVFACETSLRSIHPASLFYTVCLGPSSSGWPPDAKVNARMSRCQFIDGVCLLSAAVSACSTLPEGGQIAIKDLHLSPADLERFLAKHIESRVELASTSAMKDKLMLFENAVVLVDASPVLDSIFLAFADRPAGTSSLAMSAQGFAAALICVGLLDISACEDEAYKALITSPAVLDTNEEDVLTKKEASIAFHLAQSEDEAAATVETDDLSSGLDRLDKPEFIVACGHLAVLKWESPEIPLNEKLSRLFRLFAAFLAAALKSKR